MQKESGAASSQKRHSASVFLSASLFLPIASSLRDSLSLSLPVRQRARARHRAFYTRARLRLLSLAARETPYGKKVYGEGKPAKRTVVVRRYAEGEKLREKSTLKADESRADRVSESTKFSHEDCDRHASSCTRRIDSIPRPLYIHTPRACYYNRGN